MVLGIGEGKLEIILEKPLSVYKLGETMKGVVRLTLSGPKKARELRIIFYGEKRTTRGSGKNRRSHTSRVYEQKLMLGHEKEYPAGTSEYPFEIPVPNIGRPVEAGSSEGLAGAIMTGLQNMTDPVTNLPWFLDASLELPMSFDISKKIEISLQR